MIIAVFVFTLSLALLLWSANLFVNGSSLLAHFYKVPPLLVGIIIVGFGTSAPELFVSGISAYQGNIGIALGNVFGSNIVNIGLILGITAIISPFKVQSGVLKKELPLLLFATSLCGYFVLDGKLIFFESFFLFFLFFIFIIWAILTGLNSPDDSLGQEVTSNLEKDKKQKAKLIIKIMVGLTLLISSSQAMVWSATVISKGMGFKSSGKVNQIEGGILILIYIAYTYILLMNKNF